MKLLFAVLACCCACSAADSDWLRIFQERLPEYGHRNWVVIADSAYPSQSRPGIETVVSDAGQVDVLRRVLDTLKHARHVNPIVFTDQEMQYLDENDAPGIEIYRSDLAQLLDGRTATSLPHLDIIKQLDQVSQTFHVLVIKTNMTIPYTSVFLQLDCAYWGADAEKKLRGKMAAKGVH